MVPKSFPNFHEVRAPCVCFGRTRARWVFVCMWVWVCLWLCRRAPQARLCMLSPHGLDYFKLPLFIHPEPPFQVCDWRLRE